MDIVKIENLKELIIEVRGQSVLLDSDVAQIYGVETRDINNFVLCASHHFLCELCG